MKIKKLTLAKLTRYASQVEVDFSALGPGVIAITGPNGAGKTSLLEASGPGAIYREMPTRTPAALGNWLKPGGAITLAFDHKGAAYEAKIVAAPKTGEQSATLSKDGKPITSGKVKDFDAAMMELFGSRQSFYASVFAMQGGGGRFSSLSVADRKALFRYYLGLDRVARLHGLAKAKLAVAAASAKVEPLEAELEGSRRTAGALTADVAVLEARLKECSAAALAASERHLAASKAASGLDVLAEYNRALDDLLDVRDDLDSQRRRKPAAPSGERPSTSALNAELEELDDLRKEHGRLAAAAAKLQGEEEALQERMDAADRSAGLLRDVPCAGEGEFASCPLLRDAKSAQAASSDLERKLVAASEAKGPVLKRLAECEKQIASSTVRERLARVSEDQRAWDAAQRQLESWAVRLGTLQALDEERTAACKEWKAKLDALPAPVAEGAAEAEAEARRAMRDAQDQLGHVQEALGRASGRLEEVSKKCQQLELAVAAAHEAAEARQPMELLARVLGPDGIQAFEIDAAGPGVSALANDLLSVCYGTRFRLEVVTTKELKSKPGLYAEDFNIVVHDSERAMSHGIEALSGGEQAIVGEALRTALTLFAVQRVGLPIETLYRDETVGDLDPENAARYVLMLHRARKIGSFHQVLYVTHDERAIDTATAVVRIDADGNVSCERGGA